MTRTSGWTALSSANSTSKGAWRFRGTLEEPRAVLHGEPDRSDDVIERVERVGQPEPSPIAGGRGECDPGAVTQPIAPALLCAQVEGAQLGAVTWRARRVTEQRRLHLGGKPSQRAVGLGATRHGVGHRRVPEIPGGPSAMH